MSVTYSLPTSALQAALYARLGSILASVGILDHTLEDHDFPYASIGEFTVTDAGNKTRAVYHIESPIHIWSNQEGAKECQDIANTVLQSLTGSYLSVTGYSVMDTSFISFTTSAEPSSTELLRHGVLTVRWTIM